MADVFNLGGLNLQINPLLIKEGEAIRAVNVDLFPFGAVTKRPGYNTYLGTPDNASIPSLFSFTFPNGTQLYTYRQSGGTLYYSTQGTGAWTVCGNGTITAGSPVFNVALGGTMLISQGGGTTRHTTNGTSFTDTSLAPVGVSGIDYQGRAYLAGTASTAFYSVSTDITNWNLTGTSDSSSFFLTGAGKLNAVMKVNNRAVFSKNSGVMLRWDGFNLLDIATNLGPTSPYSIAKTEDFAFWLNRLGFFSYGGDKPQLISNAIQRQVYNAAGEGIAGTTFDNAPAVAHRYDYFCSVGTVTDDLTDETVPDCVEVYNYQLNNWRNYQFNNSPTAFHSYKDLNGVQQMIFGDSGGQCYQISGTATTDNGASIASVVEYLVHAQQPASEKKWNWLKLFFNPGAAARVAVALSDSFNKLSKNWIDLGDAKLGYVEYRFPAGSRSRLLFIKVYESSRNSRYSFFGFSYDAEVILK